MSAAVTPDLLRTVHALVQRHFVWAPDRETYGKPDHWEGFAAAVRRGDLARGDCEDFAITCAELLRDDHGVDPAALRLVYCITPRAGHMILCVDGVETQAGETVTVALDNRQRAPVEWRGLGYRMVSGMRLSEPGEWQTIPN